MILRVWSFELTVLGSFVYLGQEEHPSREWISLLEVTVRELNPRSRAPLCFREFMCVCARVRWRLRRPVMPTEVKTPWRKCVIGLALLSFSFFFLESQHLCCSLA